MARGEAILRPNGKWYQSRQVVFREVDSDPEYGWPLGVVFGTHDIDRARKLAARHTDQHLTDPRTDWWKSGFQDGEKCWLEDPVRGTAVVIFDLSDDPEKFDQPKEGENGE